MIAGLEGLCQRWLRVPPEPSPPAGSPGSLRVFRAGQNYLRLRLIVWVLAQVGAVFGILISLMFVREIEHVITIERAQRAHDAAVARAAEVAASTDGAPAAEVPASADAPAATSAPAPVEVPPRGFVHQRFYDAAPPWLRGLPGVIPARALPWIWVIEIFGVIGFVVQFFWSFVAVWIDYHLRWYMVTDRSLRLRWGVLNIQESTMSFANLQQVAVHQGPLQRLLKLADVEVQSAGGGARHDEHGHEDSMHRCVFHAVDNATEIRDLILARLQNFRQAGLGDPDDHESQEMGASVAPAPVDAGDFTTITAARAILEELRTWRASLAQRQGKAEGK